MEGFSSIWRRFTHYMASVGQLPVGTLVFIIIGRPGRQDQPKRGTVVTGDTNGDINNRIQLHFSDPRAYAAIYTHGSKFTKDPHFYTCFGEDETSFGYTDRREAKVRKDVLSPLFSRRSILKLEHVVQEKVEHMFLQLGFAQ